MFSCQTNRILSVGDKFQRGTIIKIESEDRGWVLTLRYKGIKDREVFVYQQ